MDIFAFDTATPDVGIPKILLEVNMEKRKRVVVYGNSLSMAGFVASLKADTTIDVICVNLDSHDAQQSLDENDLVAIVFDLSDPPHPDFTLLRDRPGLLLIGVDATRDEILILSSHPARALTMADLFSVIQFKEFPSSSLRKEDHEINRQS